MQFKKHIHADLIKEYARQKAEGELEYFCWEYYEPAFGKWHKTCKPKKLKLPYFRGGRNGCLG
jgi:hypothetical protein